MKYFLALGLSLGLLLQGCGGTSSERTELWIPVQEGRFDVGVQGEGNLEPVQQSIYSCLQGVWGIKVAEVALPGTQVTTGDLLVQMDMDRYEKRIEDERRKRADSDFQLEKMRTQQEQAESEERAALKEKQQAQVAAEDKLEILLRGPLREEIQAQGTQVKAGKIYATEVERRLANEKKMRDRGFTSELAFLDAQGEYEKAELRLEAAALELQRLKAGPRTEERRKLQAELEMILAETDKMEHSFEDQNQVRKLSLKERRLRLKNQGRRLRRLEHRMKAAAIEAETSGTVVHSKDGILGRETKIGDDMWGGRQILRVVSTDLFQVLGRISERDLDAVKVGAKVRVEVPSMGGKTYDGEVFKVANFATPRYAGEAEGDKVFEVHIRLPRTQEELRPNAEVRFRVLEADGLEGYRLPREALHPQTQEVFFRGLGRRKLPFAAEDRDFVYVRGEPLAKEVLYRAGAKAGELASEESKPQQSNSSPQAKSSSDPASASSPKSAAKR